MTSPPGSPPMATASTLVARSPADCWRLFIDAAALTAWVPGLRRARIVATDAQGRALEVAFEFAASRTYALVYAYDDDARRVSWTARLGQRDGVAGWARFDAEDGGTRVTYATTDGAGRTADERAIDEPRALLAAFARWAAAAR